MVTVEYARDALNRVVTVLDAGRTPPYTCLECGKPLIIKDGAVRATHFAHLPNLTDELCPLSYRNTLHLRAEHALLRSFRICQEEGRQMHYERTCEKCKAKRIDPFPKGIVSIAREFRLDLAGEVAVADIAYLDLHGNPLLLVEVYESHRVDERKQRRLATLGVPWLEVNAREVAGPEIGKPGDAFTLRPFAGNLGPFEHDCRPPELEHQRWLDEYLRAKSQAPPARSSAEEIPVRIVVIERPAYPSQSNCRSDRIADGKPVCRYPTLCSRQRVCLAPEPGRGPLPRRAVRRR